MNALSFVNSVAVRKHLKIRAMSFRPWKRRGLYIATASLLLKSELWHCGS